MIILPPSPEPDTIAISIPFSSANFLAKGDAIILPLLTFFTATTGVAKAFGVSTGAATAGAAAAFGVSATGAVLESREASAALTSASLAPMIANTLSTGADSPS